MTVSALALVIVSATAGGNAQTCSNSHAVQQIDARIDGLIAQSYLHLATGPA